MNEATVGNAMLALITGFAKWSSEMNQGVFTHLSQGLGVINSNLIHQHGGVGDDPGLIAALQTASGSPKQGHVGGP